MLRLLESTKTTKKGRSAGGTIFSIIFHVLVISFAIFATARAGTRKPERVKAEKVNFVAVKKDEPPPPPKKEPPPPPKKAEAPKPKAPKIEVPKLPKVEAPAPPQGFKVIAPPVAVPTNLPSIDLSKAVTNEADFSGKGVAGGTADGVKGGTGKEGDTGKSAGEAKPKEEDHGPYMEFQVETPVSKIGGEAPEYPSALKDQGVEGQVLAQFVVNESGRYEAGTLKILSSSNSAFTAAVKDALPRMKFSAARIGGKKVQQLVQMPFQFNIKR